MAKTILDGIDEDAEARAIAEAEADVAAGRVVPHDEVVKWLRSWGRGARLTNCPAPFPSPDDAGRMDFLGLGRRRGHRRYIGNFNPYAARDMADRIIEAANSLATFPYRGRQVPGTSLRETTLARPYIIRYRVDPDRVVILRVRRGSCHPTRP
jgi:toxin ParE1/3/4